MLGQHLLQMAGPEPAWAPSPSTPGMQGSECISQKFGRWSQGPVAGSGSVWPTGGEEWRQVGPALVSEGAQRWKDRGAVEHSKSQVRPGSSSRSPRSPRGCGEDTDTGSPACGWSTRHLLRRGQECVQKVLRDHSHHRSGLLPVHPDHKGRKSGAFVSFVQGYVSLAPTAEPGAQ